MPCLNNKLLSQTRIQQRRHELQLTEKSNLSTSGETLLISPLKEPLPVLGKIGTPLLFDIGVYLLVLGVTLMIIFALAED